MTRRVGMNCAALSLMMDAALVWVALALAEYWRPGLTWLPLSRAVGDSDMVPLPLYVAIALVWVATLLAFRLYDTSATVAFGGELRIKILGSGFAALATAGLLYLSYRDVSRWLFLLFAETAFALLFSRRLLARLLTVTPGCPPVRRRRALAVGAGPIAAYVGSRIAAHDRQGLTLLLCCLLVCAAASVPYLSTLQNYFVGDDFGIVQLFSHNTTFYFLSLFATPMGATPTGEGIWGFTLDELRPIVGLSYQFDFFRGGGSPVAFHASNIAFHVLNALLVFAIARFVVRLNISASTFAGLVFA